MPKSEPKSDDEMSEAEFWNGYVRDSVSQSMSNIQKSGSTIQTGVGLFWTIYTTAAIIGTTLFKPGFPWYIHVAIAIPIFVVMGAYYQAIRVQVHTVEHWPLNNIDEIKKTHREVILARQRSVNQAMRWLAATAAAVAVAIALVVTYQPSGTPSMQVSDVTIDNQKTVAVSGYFPPDTKLDLIITYRNASNTDVVEFFGVQTTPASGNVISSITLEGKATTYTVIAQWTGADSLLHTLQKTVNP